jgi:glycolate oxidase
MLSRMPLNKLEKIVGKDNFQIQSDRVFISPETASAISEIVKLANKERFKILPLGSSSILDGSKLSGENLVILKSDKLNQIKKVVPEDLYVILEAGFPLKDLNRHLEPFNLFYPLADDNSHGTIGGSVATNIKGKSGQREIQTKDYVLALEVVNPEGQLLHVGARTFKSVTGYDLPRLFVGSRGTLGFISEISLRLVPARKKKDYPSIILDPSPRRMNKDLHDLSSVLSSRIKKELDPNGVFLSFNSLQ